MHELFYHGNGYRVATTSGKFLPLLYTWLLDIHPDFFTRVMCHACHLLSFAIIPVINIESIIVLLLSCMTASDYAIYIASYYYLTFLFTSNCTSFAIVKVLLFLFSSAISLNPKILVYLLCNE